VVTLQLGRAAFVDVPTVLLGLAAAGLLLATRIRATWLVVGAAAVGVLLQALSS
jgi:chromate transporter